MANIAERLRQKMAEQGFTQYRLWKLSGVSQPTIKRILDGDSKEPDKSTVERLAKALGCSYTELYDGTSDSSSESANRSTIPTQHAWDNILPLQESAARKLPLISLVSAGMIRDVEDPYPVGGAEDWLLSPFEAGPNAYLLTVDGDSMYNPDPDAVSYRHGDIIHVEPAERASHGDDVIARTPDGKATFKRYKESPDGPYLEAANPDWPDRIIKMPEGTVVCGVVIGSWRRSKRK